MKLKRLKIEKFRGVQPGTVIEFNDGFNVLLGQNGTGKTTLLRLISSIFVGDFRWLEGESFAIEYELSVGPFQVGGWVRNDEVSHPVIQGFSVPQSFRPTFEVRFERASRPHVGVHLDGERMTLTNYSTAENQTHDFKVNPFHAALYVGLFPIVFSSAISATRARRLASEDSIWDEMSRSIYGAINAWRLDESLELFSAITARTSQLGLGEYDRLPVRVAVSREEQSGKNEAKGALIAPELRHHAMKVDVDSNSPPPWLSVRTEVAGLLADVLPLMGFAAVESRLEFLEKKTSEKGNSIEYGKLRFFFTRRDGSIINQDHLSYGQKRLLTFYYYLACNPDVVIADELVNGLHHSWIEECMKAMAGRQVFLTSQNPILLDHLSFDSAETVRRTFVTCEAIPEGPRDRILWGNMSKKDAASFYKAYKVGIQHVGDILRTKGLW